MRQEIRNVFYNQGFHFAHFFLIILVVVSSIFLYKTDYSTESESQNTSKDHHEFFPGFGTLKWCFRRIQNHHIVGIFYFLDFGSFQLLFKGSKDSGEDRYFPGQALLVEEAKGGILMGSVLSALAGFAVLRWAAPARKRDKAVRRAA